MAKAKLEKRPRIKIAEDPKRLSVPAHRLLDNLGRDRLCRQFVSDERIPRGVIYWLEPSGKKAPQDAAEELIRKERVRAVADGLFGDGDSQTWEARP